MTSEIPTISITHAAINGDLSESSEEEDSVADFPGGVTDVEDFNSHDEASDDENDNKYKKKFRKNSKKSITAAVTDIEDYEDSGSDDEISDIPDIKLSFREFLDQGFVEEEFHNADGMKTRSAVKSGKKRSSVNNNLGITANNDDRLTDCENYNTSGDEISEIDDNMIETNLTSYLPDVGRLDLTDKIEQNISKKKQKQQKKPNIDPELSDAESDNVNKTASDDSSDTDSDSDISYSHAEGAVGGAVSEIEDLLCSGAEQINIEDSDSSNIDSDSVYNDYPNIDVKFISTCTKNRPHKLKKPIQHNNANLSNSKHLYISSPVDGQLTDIEKLDDSQAEDSKNESDNEDYCGILIARAIIPQETETDLEDFEIGSDVAEELLKYKQVNLKIIPPPVRDLVRVHENTNGDPITRVEPLGNDLEIGLHDYENEPNKTDEENISDVDMKLLMCEAQKLRRKSPILIENDMVRNQESIKNLSVKRSDILEEPITDVEELFMSGTARRKKPIKTKTGSRNKPQRLLSTKSISNINDVKTDIEEMNLSDFENSKENKKKLTKSQSENILPSSYAAIEAAECLNLRQLSPEPKTDIENVTGDEDDSISDVDQKSANVELLGHETYMSTICSRDALTERGSQIIRKPSPIFIPILKNEMQSESNSQCVTDVEDMGLQSDVEDLPFHMNIINDNSATIELNAVLQECSHSTVHEKSQNSFNIEKEKDFIKGMNQFSDAYTDVEYIEEDVAKEVKEN